MNNVPGVGRGLSEKGEFANGQHYGSLSALTWASALNFFCAREQRWELPGQTLAASRRSTARCRYSALEMIPSRIRKYAAKSERCAAMSRKILRGENKGQVQAWI